MKSTLKNFHAPHARLCKTKRPQDANSAIDVDASHYQGGFKYRDLKVYALDQVFESLIEIMQCAGFEFRTEADDESVVLPQVKPRPPPFPVSRQDFENLNMMLAASRAGRTYSVHPLSSTGNSPIFSHAHYPRLSPTDCQISDTCGGNLVRVHPSMY